MDTKTLLLATIGILAVAPEIFGADTQDICAKPPVLGFLGSFVYKWGYFPDAKKCRPFTWGGVAGKGNYFESEKECMDACRPAPPSKPVKNYNVVSGQCICRCPRCDVNSTVKAPANAIVVTPKYVESQAKTTEKSTEKLTTSTEETTAQPISPQPTTTKSPRGWFSNLFNF